MDTRDRRQRQSRCLTSALLFVLFVAALALSLHHHFGHPHRPHPPPPSHRHRVPWDGPRKIVIQERKALIMLGWGQADLVSHAILELAPVQHITLHILHAEISTSRPHPIDRRRPQEPVLHFKIATIVDSKLVTFYIPEDDPDDSARLTVKIQVPYGFDGSLSLEGSFLDIRSLREQQQQQQWWWQWQQRQQLQQQQEARFSELSLTTDEGSIDLRGWNTRAAVFKAVVKRRGDVHTEALGEAVLGGGLEAVVKSAAGLVSLDVSMTRLLEPLEWTGAYYIQTVVGQGRLQLNVQASPAGEAEGGVDVVVVGAVQPRVLRIEAETKDGDMDARIELMEGQGLRLEAESAGEATVKLSDSYSGTFSAASTEGEAKVVPKRESESVIHYQRLGREEWRGVKYPAGAEGVKDIVGDHVRVTGTSAAQIIFI
ncbi:unnamed protein product [Mortierella alpina]